MSAVSTALAAHQYLTERVILLPDSTFTCLKESTSEGFPDIVWVYGVETSRTPLLDIVTRAVDLH